MKRVEKHIHIFDKRKRKSNNFFAGGHFNSDIPKE